MHERHIVEGVVSQVLAKAKEACAAKVTKVTLVAGELSGLDEGSIRLYFEDIAAGTIAQGAEVVVNSRAAKLRCNTCDMVFDRKIGQFDCPRCKNLGVLAESAKVFYVESIEVESA